MRNIHTGLRPSGLMLTLLLFVVVFFVADLAIGPVSIPLSDLFGLIFGEGTGNAAWRYILFDFRLPKA